MTLNQHTIDKYVINARLMIEILNKLINIIPGLRLLKSSLPGFALRTHVESLGKHLNVNKCSSSLAW